MLQIFPIPLPRLTGVIFSDASLGNCKDGGSQVCYVACVADQEILEGAETNVSVLAYKSHRMNRSASNVLYTESFGMSDGLAFGEWMASWFGLCKDIDYDLRQRDTLNRDIQLQSIMSKPESELPQLLAVSDSKSLFDKLIVEQFTNAEKRAALEVAVYAIAFEASEDNHGGFRTNSTSATASRKRKEIVLRCRNC